jgi:hypothetical protein
MMLRRMLFACGVATCAHAQVPVTVTEFPEQPISSDSALAAREIGYGAFVAGKSAKLIGADKNFGEVYKVAIGDTMFSEFDYTVRVAAKLRSNIAFIVPDTKKPERHDVSSQDLLTFFLDANDGGMIQLCTETNTVSVEGKPRFKTCFNDIDKDQKFDEVQRWVGMKRKLPETVPYRLFGTAITRINSRYELVYLGMNGSVLRIAYREYSNELARPAFSNELTFNVDPKRPTPFRYRDLRFEVLSIDGEGITYKLSRIRN